MKWHDYQTFTPIKNEIQLPFSSLDLEEKVKVIVFNIAGEKIQEFSSDLLSGNISLGNNLPKGFLLVQVQRGEEKKVYRIFKN